VGGWRINGCRNGGFHERSGGTLFLHFHDTICSSISAWNNMNMKLEVAKVIDLDLWWMITSKHVCFNMSLNILFVCLSVNVAIFFIVLMFFDVDRFAFPVKLPLCTLRFSNIFIANVGYMYNGHFYVF
jgi:hypothetical protein